MADHGDRGDPGQGPVAVQIVGWIYMFMVNMLMVGWQLLELLLIIEEYYWLHSLKVIPAG